MGTIKTITVSVFLSVGIFFAAAMCFSHGLVAAPSQATTKIAATSAQQDSLESPPPATPEPQSRLVAGPSTNAAAAPQPSAVKTDDYASAAETNRAEAPPSAAEVLMVAEEAFRQEPRDASWANDTERELVKEANDVKLPQTVSVSQPSCRRNLCKVEIAAPDANVLDSAVHAYARRQTSLPSLYIPVEREGRTVAYSVFVSRDADHMPTPTSMLTD